ncbi:MAG: amidase [Gammaproteobacteria bacterium]|nr:amidase [Gammaproteobacteria bacterium]
MGEAAENGPDSVRQCVRAIHEGSLRSEALVQNCLDRIDATEPEIGAWAHLDRESALEQARALDDIRRRGKPLGKLHGIPVGIKDIFDTVIYPTECGSPVYHGRQPDADCAVVEKLREAGAVILGKTVTTEFAYMHEASTRNPHHRQFSPGGSSSGSAAAVAAGHVPLAIGSQTNGSVIRPASYCGVYGFKPSRGILSRRGVFQTSPTLDQLGLFARNPDDAAFLCDVLGGYDANDDATYLAPRPGNLQGYLSEVPIEPNFIWIDLPYADRYSESCAAGCKEAIQELGGQIETIPAPRSFSVLIECHRVIYGYEMYRCLHDERVHHGDRVSDTFRASMKIAGTISADQYHEAMETREAAIRWFRQFFHDYDAILTPSATGEAPRFGEGTGDPVCCTIWTLCGLPCLSLPLMTGGTGLPVGIQLVGGETEDDRLFRTARWLLDFLRSGAGAQPLDSTGV